MTDRHLVLLAGISDPSDSLLRPVGPSFTDLHEAAQVPSSTSALMLVYDDGGGAAARRADVVRASLTDDNVILRVVAPPASRVLLVARALAYAATEVPVGRLAAAIPDLAAEVRVHALLDSVAGLTEPSPGLGQHLLSWLPSSRFIVDATTTRLARRIPAIPAAEGPAAVVHSEEPDGAAWGDELADALRVTDAPRSVSPGNGTWGCRRWAEIGTWPGPLDEVISRVVRAQVPATCEWCGRSVALGDHCPFCASAAVRPVGEEVVA